MTIEESHTYLLQEETDRLLDNDKIIKKAIEEVEQNGIVFYPDTNLSKELENYLSSEDSFNKLTAAGYDYIKKNNLIDLLISKEIKIYQTL